MVPGADELLLLAFLALLTTIVSVGVKVLIRSAAARRRKAIGERESRPGGAPADSAHIPPHLRTAASEPETLNTLEKLTSSRQRQREPSRPRPTGLARLNSLPPLQRAVLWSEILGPPRGRGADNDHSRLRR